MEKCESRSETGERIQEIEDTSYCVLRAHFRRSLIDDCRRAFWPVLLEYLQAHGNEPNRGANRHYIPMPFEPPCFAPEIFFDEAVLGIVRGLMGERVVADQWGSDVVLDGSAYQGIHVDFKRPLFANFPTWSYRHTCW